ncbi:MAG: hypothetical protein ACYC6Y_04790, partial [Thermoguttaceae bacterium]
MHEWSETLKLGYPSPRKGRQSAYDPMSTVPIHLTLEEIETNLTKTAIARTKKLKPQLEAMLGTQQDVELSVHEWGRVIFSLFGGKQEANVCKELTAIA